MRYGLSFPPNNRMWYERPQGTGYALSLAGGTMEGPVYLWREPRYPTEAASKAYVDFAVGNTGGPWLSMHGGQMRGPLLLHHDPRSLAEAATKNYVDRLIARELMEYLPITEADAFRERIHDLEERSEELMRRVRDLEEQLENRQRPGRPS